MLNDYQDYLNALDNNKIKTHKEALKYFNVRYSSFIQNYPKESLLPACTLAENGFYFDDTTRSIRCIECEFQYIDLNNELLIDILTSHVKFKSNCEQAKKSLENALETDIDDFKPGKINTDQLLISQSKTLGNKQYLNEDARLKTFENTRLLFDIPKLVSNGFYCVLKDNLKQTIKKPNQADELETELTYIESISISLPSLYHIKCAFCSYECLVFKNSLLNTIYKSPFEEHKEKFASSCPIFMKASDNKMDFNLLKKTQYMPTFDQNFLKNKLDWLKALYDFDSVLNEQKLNDFIVNKNELKNLDELELKKLPKVIDYLVLIKKSSKNNNNYINSINSLFGFSSLSNSVLYVPTPNNTGTIKSSKTTSDFNQLQNVLNQSENVMSEKAHHPAYSQYQTRLDSFKEWPATLSQQPTDLAKAGFYYFGIKDMVKCFFCNGGLKNWDHNDDPFQDHVRWFPKCQFIKQLMGHEYVEQIKEKFKNMESGFDSGSGNTTNQINSSSLISDLPANSPLVHKYQLNKHKRSVSPRTLNSRLDTFIIRKILDNNIISRESLKQSIEIKLSIQDSQNSLNYGDDFKSPVEMSLFSFDIDQSKKSKLEILNRISDFMICNLSNNIKPLNIREFINIKYGFYPYSVRIIREEGTAENRSFCFVCLKKADKQNVDELISDLEKNSFMGLSNLTKNTNLMVIKTNWPEIEEKLKPLMQKSVDLVSQLDQLQSQQEQIEVNQELEQANVEQQAEDVAPVVKQKETKMEQDLDKQLNFVDNTALQLMEENERLKNERLCIICLTREKNVLFLPCAHLTACLDCSFSLQNCPMCRALIQATVRTFT